MTKSTVPASSLDPADVDGVIQAVRFELYRENIYGALEILDAAQAARPHARYMEQAARIRSWLGHLASREAYVAAQEQQYRGLRWKMGLKLLEKQLRMLSGRKTRKMIERRGRDPEFQELEREVAAVKPQRVLDAGSGEGGVAMALCPRHFVRAWRKRCTSTSSRTVSTSPIPSPSSSTCATWTPPCAPS